MKHIVLVLWMLPGLQGASIFFNADRASAGPGIVPGFGERYDFTRIDGYAQQEGRNDQIAGISHRNIVVSENNNDISVELFYTYKTWLVYPEHLAGPFTGGFGEESCHSCHFDYDLNMPGGFLGLKGIPETAVSGKSYEIEVTIGRPDIGAAGFQLTTRYENGTQAGTFELNEAVAFTPDTPGEVQYLQHAVKNNKPENGGKTWKFRWTAPEPGAGGPVIINLAGNAANGDGSAFEDWIMIREYRLEVGE